LDSVDDLATTFCFDYSAYTISYPNVIRNQFVTFYLREDASAEARTWDLKYPSTLSDLLYDKYV
jgi:hypothetical protein